MQRGNPLFRGKNRASPFPKTSDEGWGRLWAEPTLAEPASFHAFFFSAKRLSFLKFLAKQRVCAKELPASSHTLVSSQ